MKEEKMRINNTKKTARSIIFFIGVFLCMDVCFSMENIQVGEENDFVMLQNENEFLLIQEMIRHHIRKYPSLFGEKKFNQQYRDEFYKQLDVLVKDRILLRDGDDEDQMYSVCCAHFNLIERDYIKLDEFSLCKQKDASVFKLGHYFKDMYVSTLYQVKACEVIIQEVEASSKKHFSLIGRENLLFQEGSPGIISEGIQGMIATIDRLNAFIGDYSDFLFDIFRERKRFMVVIDDIYDIFQMSKSACLEEKNLKDSLFRLSNTINMGKCLLEDRKDAFVQKVIIDDPMNISPSVISKTTSKRSLLSKIVDKSNVSPTVSQNALTESSSKKSIKKSSSADDALCSNEQKNGDIKHKNKKEKKDKK